MAGDDWEGYEEDPELRDDTTPEYKEELFETFRSMGAGPEEIDTDPEFAEEYAEWLKTHPMDEADEDEISTVQ